MSNKSDLAALLNLAAADGFGEHAYCPPTSVPAPRDRWYCAPQYRNPVCGEVFNSRGELVANFETIEDAEAAVAAYNKYAGERHGD